MHGYDTYDIVWRQYYPAIGRFQTPDPEVENDYDLSPYSMCDNNMVNRSDPDGRFWNYVVGALAGAGVEYAGQVAGNIVQNGWNTSSFTNVDLLDIGIAAAEGAITSGGSAIKSAGVKLGVTAVAEFAKNKSDYKKSDGLTFNKTSTALKNTAIGLTVGAVSTKLKVNVLPTKSGNKAVETARSVAHSEGRGLATSEAKKIVTKQAAKNQTIKNVNKTLTNNTNKVVGSGASTIAKNKTDEKK